MYKDTFPPLILASPDRGMRGGLPMSAGEAVLAVAVMMTDPHRDSHPGGNHPAAATGATAVAATPPIVVIPVLGHYNDGLVGPRRQGLSGLGGGGIGSPCFDLS